MKTRRIIKKCITMITVLTMCIVSSISVFAKEAEVTLNADQQLTAYEILPLASDDGTGWKSGGFFNSNGYHTGAKYFSGGTIYVSLDSTNQGANGNYYVWLRNYNTGATTTKISIPMNGVATANFTNMPSGYYQLYMGKSESSSYQSYVILAYGTT